VIEQEIEIRTSDGTSDGVMFHADGNGRWPGVVFLTDAGGIRPGQREYARRLAAEGYTVLLPNVFYRTSKPPLWTFRPNFPDEKTMKRFGELAGPVTPQAAERDAEAYVGYLRQHPHVATGPLGVVGHCFTGGVALRFAAACPDDIVAAASFHGGGLYTDQPDSPHLVLSRVKARLYFGHAVNDRSMPDEAIKHLKQALDAWGGTFESEVYEGALHGWTSSDSPVYNPVQAERAFGKLTELFARTLK